MDVLDALLDQALPDMDPDTALQWATVTGKTDLVRDLIAGGATGADPQKCHVSCMWAARYGHAGVLRALLQDGRLVPRYGELLYLAIKYGHLEVVQALLQDPRLGGGQDAIEDCMYHRRYEFLPVFLADPRFEPSAYAFEVAITQPSREALHLFLDDGRVDPSLRQDTALWVAIENGWADVVQKCLRDPRTNPGVQDNLFVCAAARRDRTEVVMLLCEDPRVDPNACNGYVMYEAANRGNGPLVAALSAHPRVDPPLGFVAAVERMRNDVVNALLAAVDPFAAAPAVTRLVLQAATAATDGTALTLFLERYLKDGRGDVRELAAAIDVPPGHSIWEQYMAWTRVRAAWCGSLARVIFTPRSIPQPVSQ